MGILQREPMSINQLIYDVSKNKELKEVPFHNAGTAVMKKGKNYIVWQIVSDVPNRTIDYESKLSKVRVQFDVYTHTERESISISEKLEKMMLGKGLVLSRNGPFFNADTKTYRRIIDISILKR